MILYMGERPLFDYLLSQSAPVSYSNNLSGAEKVIISEYTDRAVRTVKEAHLINIPVLGILDGVKSIITAFDGRFEDIECAEGRQEYTVIDTGIPIFRGLETVIKICRGKPIGILETLTPSKLDPISRSGNGDVLAICNLIAPDIHGNVYGLNFYMTSELTPDAKTIIKNFIEL